MAPAPLRSHAGGVRRLLVPALLLAPALSSGCARYIEATDLADVEDSVTAIEVGGNIGHLSVEGVDGGPLHVERVVHAAEGSFPTAIYELREGVVHLRSRCDDSPRCEIRHRVRAPRELPIHVDLDVAYVEIRAMAGAIDLELETGNIDVVDVSSAEVRARVTAGDIDLIFTEVPRLVDARIEAGTLTIAVPAGSYRCEFEHELAHNHIENVVCSTSAEATIRAHVGVGSIRVIGR